jgi:cytochrome c553
MKRIGAALPTYMKKLLRILAVVVAVLLLVAGGIAAYVFIAFNGLWTTKYSVPRHEVAVSTGEASLAEGRRLLQARACTECHGADLGGRYFLEEAALGRIYARNLTTGHGGDLAAWSNVDLERAIRHGVKPDGTPLVFMPANEFWAMSDEELGSVIQAIRAQPPVDRANQPNSFTPLMRGLSVFGVFPLVPASHIDQQKPHPAPVAVGASAEYGRYLAVACSGCHGETFSGGPIPGAPATMPVPRNLTPAPDGLGRYTQQQFATMLRTGTRPDGTMINEFMPWKVYANLTDTEVQALYAFLQTVPPKPFGGR